MGIRIYKPTSPGRRQMSVSDFSELTGAAPERSLLEGLVKSSGGRNAHGHDAAPRPRQRARRD